MPSPGVYYRYTPGDGLYFPCLSRTVDCLRLLAVLHKLNAILHPAVEVDLQSRRKLRLDLVGELPDETLDLRACGLLHLAHDSEEVRFRCVTLTLRA